MKVLKPPKLNIGDTIAVVASSLPVLPHHQQQYLQGKKLIEEMGFKVKEGHTIGKTKWWTADSPQEVAVDINNQFADSNVKAIIAHTGGYSAISVIEHLDYQLIAKNPKPFIGMSDMTVYHLAIFAKTGLVGFHMDYLANFTGEHFLQFLAQNQAPGMIKPKTDWEEWRKGQANGPLIGGLLERMSVLAGTDYFPAINEFGGAILFWEEIGRDMAEIYQYLYQLKNMGILAKINGMLIGKVKYLKPVRGEEEFQMPSLKEMVLDIVKDYNFPIMANLDFGHITGNIPMPVGIKAAFDTDKLELKFLEGSVV